MVGGVTLGASLTALAGGIVLIATSGTDVEIMAPRRDSGSTGTASASASASATQPHAHATTATARAPRYWAGEF